MRTRVIVIPLVIVLAAAAAWWGYVKLTPAPDPKAQEVPTAPAVGTPAASAPDPSLTDSSPPEPAPSVPDPETPEVPVGTLTQPSDALPRDDVPWAEVGGGWFLVEWQVAADENTRKNNGGFDVVSDELLLLSPSGQFYSVGSLAGLSALANPYVAPIAWYGDYLTFGRAVPKTWVYEPPIDIIRYDLRSGETATVRSNWTGYGMENIVDRNSFVGGSNGGDTEFNFFYDAAGDEHTLCKSVYAPSLSPGGSYFVCPEQKSSDPGRTHVNVAFLDGGFSREEVTVLKDPISDYLIDGWISEDTFLLSREGDDGNRAVFAYDIGKRKIREYTVLDPSPEHRSYDFTSSTYMVTDAGLAKFYAADGSPLAEVHCGDSPATSNWPDVVHSGQRALVICQAADPNAYAGKVWLVDLGSGENTLVVAGESVRDTGIRDVQGYASQLG